MKIRITLHSVVVADLNKKGFTCSGCGIRPVLLPHLTGEPEQVKPFFGAEDMSANFPHALMRHAQAHASDVLKRRWPNRYIAKPVINIDECVDGLIEIGAIQKCIADTSKKMALLYWLLSRIEKKEKPQEGKPFYKSSAWRKVRFSVLKENGGSCTACGAKASDGIRLHVDHIEPRSKRPELALDASNLQVLCEECNLGKSDSDAIRF